MAHRRFARTIAAEMAEPEETASAATPSVPSASVRNVVKRIWDGRERRTVLDDVSFELGAA